MSKKYELLRFESDTYELVYQNPSSEWLNRGRIVVFNHRQLSQLGTCFAAGIDSRRTMYFGDETAYNIGKMVFAHCFVIHSQIFVDNKLFRFVRS